MRTIAGPLILGAAFALQGCESTGPSDPLDFCVEPFVQASVQARDFLVTPCSANDHLAGNDSVVLVDIYFGRVSERDTATQPSEAQLDLVRDNAGEIHHVMNVRAVRASISLDGLRAVANLGGLVTARSVTDPDRHLIPVVVGIDGDLTEDHVSVFESVGGVVTDRLNEVDFLYGWIDDSSISCLRTKTDIKFVEHRMAVGCEDGG